MAKNLLKFATVDIAGKVPISVDKPHLLWYNFKSNISRGISMKILAIDQGTTSSRAIVFSEKMEILSSGQYPLTQHYPKPGWVEHDAKEIAKITLRAVFDAVYPGYDDIGAIGITNQRESTVVWDRITGEPVYNAIVWQCRRTADLCKKIADNGYSELIREKTGLPIDAYFSATKLKWILDNVPGVRERAERGELAFGTVDSWIIWTLTDGKVHATDPSNASRTMLFNIHTGEWDKELCDIFGVPMSMLPKICQTGGYIGTVASNPGIPSAIWGRPICSAVGDQQAALFGQTCFVEGEAKNTYGTGCFTLINAGCVPPKSRNLITTVAWKIGGKTVYALEGSVFNAGSSIQWLRDELGIIEKASDVDVNAAKVKDSEGVYFVSAFTGLGAPYWDMYARGTLVGITRGTNRNHICRATLEGIAYQVNDLLWTMQAETGIRMARLFVDGGACVSDIMMQFQADISGCTVDRPVTVESTALGAAMLAAIGAGLMDMSDLSSLRVSQKIFEPQMTEEERSKKLEKWRKAVKAARIII